MTSLTSIQAALTDVEAAQKTGAQIGHHPQLQAQLATEHWSSTTHAFGRRPKCLG
jgi:hypothetical protein